jgi:D-sedoheptulose 7-phosphate isomerase
MDLTAFYDHEFDEHEAIVRATRDAVSVSFAALCGAAQNALSAGNKIVFFGNGGSAADSQHLATELVVRYKTNRAPLAAIALTTDSSLLTAAANDFGYDTIFECQIRALGKPGDLAVGITTSGTSANVVRALQAARETGMVAAALTGRGGGDLPGLADPVVMVPSTTIARIQEMHIMIGHMLCDVLEQTCGR